MICYIKPLFTFTDNCIIISNLNQFTKKEYNVRVHDYIGEIELFTG